MGWRGVFLFAFVSSCVLHASSFEKSFRWNCGTRAKEAGRRVSETVLGKPVTYIAVDETIMAPVAPKKPDQEWLYVDAGTAFPNWEPDTELFVGATNGAHGYVAGKDFRLEANLHFNGYSTRPSPWVSPGLIFHLKGLPPDRVKKVANAVQSRADGIAGLSCIDKTNAALQYGGIRIRGGNPILPADQLEGWLFKGFELEDGTPIEADIYVSDGYALERMISLARKRQYQQTRVIEETIRQLRDKDVVTLLRHLTKVNKKTLDYITDPELKRWLELVWPG